LVLVSLFFLGLGQMSGFAQTIFQYTNNSGGAPNYVDPNADDVLPNLARGGGVSNLNLGCTGAAEGFGATGWPVTNVFDVGVFNVAGDYVEFTLDPNPGFGLKVTGFSARSRRENVTGTADDGPISIRYGYSVDFGATWTTVYPGNPQSSNLCNSGGVQRVWPAWVTVNTNHPIKFRIYGLSSGSSGKGDLFLRDVIVEGAVCDETPNITLEPIPALCFANNVQSANMDYADAVIGNKVEVDFVSPNISDLPLTTLMSATGSFSFDVLSGTAPGNYAGTLTVSNSCGFETDYPISVTVNAMPNVSVSLSALVICAREDVTLTFEDLGATGHTFHLTADLVDDNGTSMGEIDYTGVSDGASIVYTEGVDFDGAVTGTVSLVNILVVDESTACENTLLDLDLTVNPLPDVSITLDDLAICDNGSLTLTFTDHAASGHLFSITADLVDDNGTTVGAINYTNIPSGATDTYTDGIDFEGSMGCTVSLTNILVTDETTGCENTTLLDLSITVNPLPSALLSVVPSGPICPGATIEIHFEESNWPGGTEFTVGGDASPLVFGLDTLTLYEVIDGDHLDLTEGTAFTGDLKISNIVVTESISGCSSPAYSVNVDVHDAPTFEFSAASGVGAGSGNNTSGPNTLDIDFCAGDNLTLADYGDNGNIGFTVSFTSSGNATYDGGPIPAMSGPTNVAADDASTFFGSIYGGALGYGLASGTLGTINQIFVPYLDVDDSGTLTPGDCEGDPMYLNYNIHAIPTVSVTPVDIAACNGAAVDITFTGNYPSNEVTYAWTNDNIAIGLIDELGTGDISFTGTNNTNAPIVANLTVTPFTDYCEGTTVNFTVTIYPEPVVTNITATVDGGSPQSGNNVNGPNTINLDFCAGQSFTYSLYDGTPGIGFIEEITAGTTNLRYGVTPIPVPRPQSNIAPGAAAAFFAGTYGPYNLAPGETYGWMSETFTPYFDANNDGDYDAMTDCLGDPITVVYKVYAPIVVNVVRNANDLCSGGQVNYTLSTTSTQNVLFDLSLSENTNAGNPADLDDDNTLPVVLTGLSINDLTSYHFLQVINNAAGTFDRGRVTLSVSNIHYADTDVACGSTVNIPNPNTQVFPKPSLEDPANKLICDGSSVNLDIDTLVYSINPGAAGFPLRIEWTATATNVTGESNSFVNIYTGAGLEAAIHDITDVLTLVDPMMNGSVKYTITPRASGPTNGFNGDDCFGDPIQVTVTVVAHAAPEIAGNTCTYVGAQVQLTGTPNINAPATLVAESWSSTAAASVDSSGLVTGLIPGHAIISYTVTDDAGCVSTATYAITVLNSVTLTSTSSSSAVSCGEEFTVTVKASNICDISTLDYNFEWDENLFQFVTHSAPMLPGGLVLVNTLSVGSGEFFYTLIDDGIPPFGEGISLADNTVILTYTLRAIGNAGIYNVPNGIILADAFNSFPSELPMVTTGVSVEIEPLSLSLLGDPDVCPSDDNAYLLFDPMSVQGNPNHYIIMFDGCPGFPSTQEGTLVVMDGQIVIPLPPSFISGTCSAEVVISNSLYGCESAPIPFSILNDDDEPTVPTPAPISQQCFPVPAPNVNVVIGETDTCTDPEDLIVAYEAGLTSDNGGSGCSGDPFILERVYSVTDEAGNVTTVTQVITVEDDQDPFLLNPPALSVWYPSEAAAIAAAIAHADLNKRDNCTTQVGISAVLVPSTMMSPNPSYMGCTATIRLLLSDACGNITQVVYTTVVDNEDPTITDPDPLDDCYSVSDDTNAPHYPYQDAVDAALAAVTAVADDNCTDPNDLVITAATSGTPCLLNIVVSVADACGRTTTYTYTTRVESDGPYVPASPLALEGECFDSEAEAEAAAIAIARVGAGDNCTSPNLLQFDAFVNPGCPADVMVVVTDFCGNPTKITFTGVHIDTEDPEAFGSPSQICFQSLTGPLGAYAVLVADAAPTDNCTSTPELIASAVESAGFTPDNINAPCNEGTVEFTFTDNCGNALLVSFYGIIIDNQDPTANLLSPLNFDCLSEAIADVPDIMVVNASDNCGVQDIEHISTTLPMSCPGTGVRTYRVTDCAGNFIEVTQSIVVSDDVAPTFTQMFSDDLDRSFACGDPLLLQAANDLEPTVQDNCGEPYVIKTAGPFVPGECPQTGTYTNTFRAYDDCGNSSTTVYTQVITVYDNEVPNVDFGCMFAPLVLTTLGGAECPNQATTSLEVGDVIHPTDSWFVAGVPIPSLSGCVSDNCSPEASINIKVTSIDVDDNNLDCSRSITISFEISDACGNVNPMPFVCEYIIRDDVAPTWITVEGVPYPNGLNVTVDCDDVAELAFANFLAPEAIDECSNVTVIKDPGMFVAGGDCPQEGTITNTWRAYDDCGNTSLEFTQVITVIDNAGPEWNTLPEALDTEVSCSNPSALGAAQALAPVAEDNCDVTLSPTKNGGTLVPGNCPGTGTITNTWTVTDDCGNISGTYTQVISIVDNEDPQLFCAQNIPDFGGPELPSDCYSSKADAEAAALEFFDGPSYQCDNCTAREDLVLTVSTNENYPGYPCEAPVTVILTDCAGNTDSYTFYTRIDGEKPTLVPSTIATCYQTLGDAQAAIYTATTVTDNCSPIEEMDVDWSTAGSCPTQSITMTITDGCGNSRSITYNGLCIGADSNVEITTEATAGSSTCETQAASMSAWLANHGGAVATGSGILWSYSPADPLAALLLSEPNCTTHTKSVLVTFIATDGCGATDLTTASFTVSDYVAPTVNNLPTLNLIGCGLGIVPAPPAFTPDPTDDPSILVGAPDGMNPSDNCDNNLTIRLTLQTTSGTGCPGNPYVVARTYTATDDYCRVSTATQLIKVLDNLPPTFAAPANITINVDANCIYNAFTASTGDVLNEMDNCTPSGPGLQAIYTDVVALGTPGQNPKFVITRTWTLVDACGNSAIPRTQTITVTDVISPAITGCPANLSLPGGIIELACGALYGSQAAPVYDDNCSGETLSYQLSGVSNGMGIGSVPAGTVFGEGVTTVTYTVTDAVGNSTNCLFTVTVNCVTISGRLIWEHDKATGVKDGTVSLTPTAPLVTDLSDIMGNYDLLAPANGNYTITPVKNINRLNGVNAADATAILNHVNGSALITDPYKKVCADVNRSNVITSQDATIITQSLAGYPPALAVFSVFWRFVDKSFVWPSAGANVIPPFPSNITVNVSGADIVGKDFYGMKIGDVAAAWANPANAPNIAPLVWVLQDQTLVEGSEIELTFAASNFNNLSAYQFALDFDPTQMQFVEFQPLSALQLNLLNNFGAYNADLGELRHVWSAGVGTTLADGTPVFRAKFKVLAGGQKLSDVLRIDDSQIECKAFSGISAPADVKVAFAESVGTDSPIDPNHLQLQLMQNRPNPFADATTIGFILPEACDAHIRILDISGRELTTYDRKYTAGYHELDFKMENAWTYGVLFCELVTPQGKRVIKMITAK
jgi:hypothetical protein